MGIRSVRMVNDYRISYSATAQYQIAVDQLLSLQAFRDFDLGAMEGDANLGDFITCCRTSGIDATKYMRQFVVFEVLLPSNECIELTNMDLGSLWSWPVNTECIQYNSYGDYLMLTMSVAGGKTGAMSIWDASQQKWLWSDLKSPHQRGMLYLPEVNRFISPYREIYGYLTTTRLTIVDPTSWEKDVVSLCFSRNDGQGSATTIVNSLFGYSVPFDEVESEDQRLEFNGGLMLWDGSNRHLYIYLENAGMSGEFGDHGFRPMQEGTEELATNAPIIIKHNLDPDRFEWLWAKYVRGVNESRHCTHCIRGRYSRKLSKHHEELPRQPILVLDEEPRDSFQAVYICGVAKKGYSSKKNYPHNLHAAVLPRLGAKDEFHFEDWHLEVENGVFMPIPALEEIPERFKNRPPEYASCRIFRWAVWFQDKYLNHDR